MSRGGRAAHRGGHAVGGNKAVMDSDPKVEEDGVEEPRQVWFSSVVQQKKRRYFNREWTSRDIGVGALIGGTHALALLAPWFCTPAAVWCFVAMYVLTGMVGITFSFHRQLTHKSFKTPKWIEYVAAYCGVLSNQGDPIEWVSTHRHHHARCDTPMDPHTPFDGLWWSHGGWMMDNAGIEPMVADKGNAKDLERQPFYRWLRDTYVWHVFGSAAALFAIGGMPFLVWGFAVRTCFVWHITWAVNSAAHVWGYQSWKTGDESRNNWWVAALAFGEGWHNNHHAFEYSARHGLEWWQFDPTWYLVCALKSVGLASDVLLPRESHMKQLSFEA